MFTKNCARRAGMEHVGHYFPTNKSSKATQELLQWINECVTKGLRKDVTHTDRDNS